MPSSGNQSTQRRRGRGQSRTTSRRARGAASTSRGRSTIPLRRSARLNPETQATSTLGERATEAEQIRERSRQSHRRARNNISDIRHGTEPVPSQPEVAAGPAPMHGAAEPRTYSLEVAVQPPGVAGVGRPLYPPFAVRVRIYGDDGVEITGEEELSSLFAQAALYPESGSAPPLAPPDAFLLSGRMSRSLDLLNEPGRNRRESAAPVETEIGSYAVFPDLSINQTGSYRLGVSLFKVGDARRLRSTSAASSGGDERSEGGTSLDEVRSRVLVVQQDVSAAQPSSEERLFLDHIRDRGSLD